MSDRPLSSRFVYNTGLLDWFAYFRIHIKYIAARKRLHTVRMMRCVYKSQRVRMRVCVSTSLWDDGQLSYVTCLVCISWCV